MKRRFPMLLGLLFVGALRASAAFAAEANLITGVDVNQGDGALELSIHGSRPPAYSVFKLQDPQRLVVDMAGADVTAVAAREVREGGVLRVSAAQYSDERSKVGRVIVALDGSPRYEVVARGDDVVVRILRGDAEAAARPAEPAQTVSAPAPVTEKAAAPAPETAASATPVVRVDETPVAADPAPTAPAPRPDGNVTARRMDEKRISGRPARALTRVRQQPDGVLLVTDGQVARMEILELRDPPRLALDLYGVSSAPRSGVPLTGAFTGARFGHEPGRVRVVLDASQELPACEVKRTREGLVVSTRTAAAKVQEPAPAAAQVATRSQDARKQDPPGVVAPEAQPAAPATPARIQAVKFSGGETASRIEISGKAPFSVERPDGHTLVLTLEGASLARSQQRSLDTSAFGSPVQMVSSFNQPAQGKVRIVATLRGAAEDHVAETPGGLVWSITEAGQAPAASADATPRVSMGGSEVAGFASEAPGYAASGAPQARGYTGRHITLDFHDIEIRNLLRLIADVSKRNIVVADDVSGRVTVSLRNVPWDQALDLVLRAKGLGKEEMGNVIRIAKLDAIAKEQEARAAAEKARIPLVPLKVRIIPVSFARAGDVAARVKDVLSERGTVSTDDRTNVLIVKDVPDNLVRAEGLVRNLDTETPQVLIESRIVEASNNYNRALGVQWGGKAAANQANGNPLPFIFPANVTTAGASGNDPNGGTSGTPGYAVNLPAAIGQGSGGGVGFTFGSVGGAVNLNLRLSALENTGVIKTISAPRIATIDNKEATIGQGVSIPFSQTSASGVNTTFMEAKLELKVTPHVSADGSVLLKIKATNNSPNPQLTGANGQPSIAKREAETEVLVKDGDTTVIGGIYTRSTSRQTASVPWLSKIPVLGFFFRSTTNQDDVTELLIFITPRILNRSATAAASASP